jgi:hypothetical protein
MKEIISWYFYPMTWIYPFDRNRRDYVKYFGEYKPTILKRLICYLLDEKLYPIDWEEVPPFEEKPLEFEYTNFRSSRNVKIKYYECYTQPDMLTKNDIYFRRFLLLLGFIGLNEYLIKNYTRLNYIPLFTYLFYTNTSHRRILILGWLYYLTCTMLVSKSYQRPYN